MMNTSLISFTFSPPLSRLFRLRVIRYRKDLPVDTDKLFGISELLFESFKLFTIQRAKVLTGAITDKEGTENHIHDFVILSVNCAIGVHAVKLALLVTDNTNGLLERIEGFNIALDGCLQTFKCICDLRYSGDLTRLTEHHLDFFL